MAGFDTRLATIAAAAKPESAYEDVVTDVIPIGLHNPPPTSEGSPEYSRLSMAADQPDPRVRTLAVGPFELTAHDIRDWCKQTNCSDLDELVADRRLRASTALAIRSKQFEVVLRTLEAGQAVNEGTLDRFIPADLQHVIASRAKR